MASYQVPGADGCISFKTASDLSACQYHGVKLSAADTVAIADANGDGIVGVLMNKPTSGEEARIFTTQGGKVVLYAGAAITAVKKLLTTDASGHWIMASDGDIVAAYATQTAGAAGDVIEAVWIGPHYCADISKYYDFS